MTAGPFPAARCTWASRFLTRLSGRSRTKSGLRIEIIGLVGLYTDAGHVTAYDTGEVQQEFSVCFHARPLGGELRRNSGAGEAGWVAIDYLESLSLHPTTQIRVNDALAERARPRIA